MKPAHADPEGEQGGEGRATAAPEVGQEGSEEASRPHQPPASAGVTYELCAGIVDKPHLSLEEIACQEVLEECGYEVPVSKLRRITSYRCGYIPSTHGRSNILSKPWHLACGSVTERQLLSGGQNKAFTGQYMWCNF